MSMKVLAVGAVALLLAGSRASAEVQLSIQNGRVSLVATDATVRQILTEWERVGQTKILNVERIQGGPLTLELTNGPEQEALDILAPRELDEPWELESGGWELEVGSWELRVESCQLEAASGVQLRAR